VFAPVYRSSCMTTDIQVSTLGVQNYEKFSEGRIVWVNEPEQTGRIVSRS